MKMKILKITLITLSIAFLTIIAINKAAEHISVPKNFTTIKI